MTSHSQSGQDAWVLDRVFSGRRTGYFLDIGCHDAARISNTALLEEAGWTGAAVDPFPTGFERRPQTHLVLGAVSDRRAEVEFVWPGSGHGGLVSTLSAYNVPICEGRPVQKLWTMTPDDLLERLGWPERVDYASLDVEGHELPILQAWPFHRCRPTCWTVEHNMEEPRRSLVRALLNGQGYEHVESLGWDDCFVLRTHLEAQADTQPQGGPGAWWAGEGALSHHGKYGDIVFAGPALRAAGARRLWLYPEPHRSGMAMTAAEAGFIRPLLEAQEWCDAAPWWPERVQSTLTGFRDWQQHQPSLPGQHLATVGWHDVSACEEPWLCATPRPVAELVVARTPRWHADQPFDYRWLMAQFSTVVFLGHEDEHADFQRRFGPVRRHDVRTALDMAEVIAGAACVACNPTLVNAIACGMRKPTILESAVWCNADWGRPECAILRPGTTLTARRVAEALRAA